MVLPALVAVTLALAWLVMLGVTQVRVVDAAREAARAAARGDGTARAVGLGRQVAPRGAAITVHRRDGEVVAHVRAEVHGPGGLLGFLPAVHVDADAVAASEQ